jgi:hypothetical protein
MNGAMRREGCHGPRWRTVGGGSTVSMSHPVGPSALLHPDARFFADVMVATKHKRRSWKAATVPGGL